MSYVASGLATVPSIGISLYVFFVESTWNDPIGQQLKANFETLGRRVGPNALVVRGYDEHAMVSEVVEAAELYDERFRSISPPALLVSNRPLLSLDDPPGAPQGTKIIALNVSGAEGSLTPEPWDQILPHLAAIAILLAASAGISGPQSGGSAQVTGPADGAALIDHLRADGVVLTYDLDGRPCTPTVTTRRRSSSPRTPPVPTRDRTEKGGPPSKAAANR